jgi:glycosyltransferase involved in cell wall biosynthesis
LLFSGIEDLGLIPIEANAAGCPVIAFRDGGVLDTIKENITGIFFYEQNHASLIEAMNLFESMEAEGTFKDRETFSNHVRQFSREAFKERIQKIINERKRV